MSTLTRKGIPFQSTEDCGASFIQLKTALTTAPVLVYPKFGRGNSFILETDSITVGVEDVLSQKQTDGTDHPLLMPPAQLTSMRRTTASRS